jgi:hypothetical protein
MQRALNVLDASSQPDVRKYGGDALANELSHARWAFSQDLVLVAGGVAHHLPHSLDKGVADRLMK